jgi:hypothetical protein
LWLSLLSTVCCGGNQINRVEGVEEGAIAGANKQKKTLLVRGEIETARCNAKPLVHVLQTQWLGLCVCLFVGHLVNVGEQRGHGPT